MSGDEMGQLGAETPVPKARLTVPEAFGLARPRLLRTLDLVHERHLGIVIAPAGSGKTTLLSQWTRTFDGPVAWYRAEVADANPDVLLASLGQSVARALGTAPSPMPTVDSLLLALEGLSTRMLLVLDDTQVLADSASEAALGQLLSLAPRRLRVLLAGRRRPAVNLARGEMPHAPVIVTADDLRFRSWEVESLFREFYGTPLRPDDAAVLARRTEGWAAALHLFHLSTAQRDAPAQRRAIDALAGRARYAQGYLSGEVLAGLPDDFQQFLRRTCVFDVLTGQRCDELLGIDSSQAMLEELERRQALTSSDDDGLTFRYHEVLRRHLEAALHSDVGEAAARSWYGRAADLLESEGAVVEALRARARAGQWPQVRELLERQGPAMAGHAGTDWLDCLPAWLTREDPWVAYAEARRLLDDGQLSEAASRAREAHSATTEPRARELCQNVLVLTEAWGSSTPRVTSQWYDLLRAAVRRAPLAAAAEASAGPQPSASLVEGLSLLLAGDQVGSRRALQTVIECPDDDVRPSLGARLALTFMDDDPAGSAAADDVAAEAERLGLGWYMRVGRAVAAAQRDGSSADAELSSVLRSCDRRSDAWGGLVVTALTCLRAVRRRVPALAPLRDLADRARSLDAGAVEAWARAGIAVALATAGSPEAAAASDTAESVARSAGVPGALAFAYAALSLQRPAQRKPLADLARTTARGAGLNDGVCGYVAELVGPELLSRPAVSRDVPTVPPVRLTVFGGFSVAVGGRPLDLSAVRPRARSALHLLALDAGRVVHRDRLAEALWAGLSPEAALHNVHVAVSSLRGILEPGCTRGNGRLLGREGEGYLLAMPPGSVSDVQSFESQAAAGRFALAQGDRRAAIAVLRRAIAHYAGPVLPEDGPAEWVVAVRERFRIEASEIAGLLADLELGEGQTAAAVSTASASLAIDPFRDASWRTLVLAHETAGDRASAAKARLAYGDVLRSLGVPCAPLAAIPAQRPPIGGR